MVFLSRIPDHTLFSHRIRHGTARHVTAPRRSPSQCTRIMENSSMKAAMTTHIALLCRAVPCRIWCERSWCHSRFCDFGIETILVSRLYLSKVSKIASVNTAIGIQHFFSKNHHTILHPSNLLYTPKQQTPRTSLRRYFLVCCVLLCVGYKFVFIEILRHNDNTLC